MPDKPWAVVFQAIGDHDDGTLHEVLVPPGFAFVAAQGGILIVSEDRTVTGIVSARPLSGGEVDATDGEVPEGEHEDHLDEPEPDDGGFLDDQEGDVGEGGVGDPDEGHGLHREAARSDAGGDTFPYLTHGEDCICDWCYDRRHKPDTITLADERPDPRER